MTDVIGVGHNLAPPYAQEVNGRLTTDYAELVSAAENALADANTLPAIVEGSEDVAAISAHVVKMRDLQKRAEAHRVDEGTPYLRSKEAVDAFFFRLKEKIESGPSGRKALAARVDAYKQRQLAEERRRREETAIKARQEEEERRRLADEAEARARRARSAQTKEAEHAKAARARVEEAMAVAKTEEATLATMASSSALVRERFEGTERSGQVTMRKKEVVYIEDVSKLDLESLRPFIKEEHLLMAVRQWARSTGFTQKMPGAVAEMRDDTVIR